MFTFLTESQIEHCIEIVEKRRHNDADISEIIEFIDSRYNTNVITLFLDTTSIEIVFRFDKDVPADSSKKTILKRIVSIESEKKYSYISYISFETVVRTVLIKKALHHLLQNDKELLNNMRIWDIYAISDSPVVFYFTDEDVKKSEANGNNRTIKETIENLVRHNEMAKYLANTDIQLTYNSKEIVDKHYESSLLYYFK